MANDLESLLKSSGRVRSLARGIAGSSARAEDLVQEAWVAALEKPPDEGVPILRWIAGVLRNLAREERRSQVRRSERERFVALRADSAATDGPKATAERVEAQRFVVEAVGALREPYRTAIVMRYFDGLSPR
jgi:RNA polymerase sigma factor (sigma-70 family)